jgi:hypothetical protein
MLNAADRHGDPHLQMLGAAGGFLGRMSSNKGAHTLLWNMAARNAGQPGESMLSVTYCRTSELLA